MTPADDGSPYGSSGPATPDIGGGTRIAAPTKINPGPGRKPLPYDPRDASSRGSHSRAVIRTDVRPVELTPLNYDPRDGRTAGALTRVPLAMKDNRGSDTVLPMPEHAAYAALSRDGAQQWMFVWVQQKGQRGEVAGPQFMDKLAMLSHYGDPIAARLWHYAKQVRIDIEKEMARRQSALRQSVGLR